MPAGFGLAGAAGGELAEALFGRLTGLGLPESCSLSG
jgi:hypothetical protein